MRGRIGVSAWVYWVALVCSAAAAQATLRVHQHIALARALRAYEAASRTAAAQNARDDEAADFGPGRNVNGRPIYPYSVIPGGVVDGAELKIAVRHDPVVAAHYADFNLAVAHVERLDADRKMYASYRMGDRVYWTSRPLLIRKGEAVISDGKHLARSRCGNRLSETPAAPISPEQPSPSVLAAPEAPVYFAGSFPGAPGSPLIPPGGGAPSPPTGWIIPPPIIPIVGGGPPGHSKSSPPGGGGGSPPGGGGGTPPGGGGGAPPGGGGGSPPGGGGGSPPGGGGGSPPVSVPEPDSGALLAAGLVILLGAGGLCSIRKNRKT